MELVDTPDSSSGTILWCAGSSPTGGTYIVYTSINYVTCRDRLIAHGTNIKEVEVEF